MATMTPRTPAWTTAAERTWSRPHDGYEPPAAAVRVPIHYGPSLEYVDQHAPAYGSTRTHGRLTAAYVVGDLEEDTGALLVALELEHGYYAPTPRILPTFEDDGAGGRDYVATLPTAAWPGGYPVGYVTDGEVLCPDCATAHLYGSSNPDDDDYAGRPDWLYGRHGAELGLSSAILQEPAEYLAEYATQEATLAHLKDPEAHNFGTVLELAGVPESWLSRHDPGRLARLHATAHSYGPALTVDHAEDHPDGHDVEPEWDDVPYEICGACSEPIE